MSPKDFRTQNALTKSGDNGNVSTISQLGLTVIIPETKDIAIVC